MLIAKRVNLKAMAKMKKTLKIKRDFSCGGVVWNESEATLLLIYVQNLSRKKVWTFPKGHPEGQEIDENAALREVREETGWLCEIVNPLLDVTYSYVDKDIKYNKVVRWFLMTPLEKVGNFDQKEVIQCKWVSLDEAKSILTYESDQKLLKRFASLV